MKSVVRKLKPTSAGRRHVVQVTPPGLSKSGPHRPLVAGKRRVNGRGAGGRISTRHRGGGHKRLYRAIDFRRNKDGITAKVTALEYDPNRTAYIALLSYADGEWRYVIAPRGMKVGDAVVSGSDAAVQIGNCLPIEHIPVGTIVHCVELKPGKGAQIARSAGTSVQIVAKEDRYALLRLRSGEIRKVLITCRATVGEVCNSEHSLRRLGKAGKSRHLGRRPTVRGTAMNPVDHPHGGGEGRTRGRHPVSPWGVPTKGKKTRSNKRTDSMIVRRRKNKRKK